MSYKSLICGILIGFIISLCCNNKFLSWTQKKAWFQLGYATQKGLPPKKIGGDTETFIAWSYGNYVKECVKVKEKNYKLRKINQKEKQELYKECLGLLYHNLDLRDLQDYRLNIELTKKEKGFTIEWDKLLDEIWSNI